MNAAAIYAQEFAACAKSPEWKEGARRGLQCALGEAQPLARPPYTGGTAQYDAWAAGIQAGLAEGKHHRQQECHAMGTRNTAIVKQPAGHAISGSPCAVSVLIRRKDWPFNDDFAPLDAPDLLPQGSHDSFESPTLGGVWLGFTRTREGAYA